MEKKKRCFPGKCKGVSAKSVSGGGIPTKRKGMEKGDWGREENYLFWTECIFGVKGVGLRGKFWKKM